MAAYCYLIHFSVPIGNPNKPLGQAQHYLGYTRSGIKKRFEQHKSGNGAKITQAACRAGVEMVLARTWRTPNRELERQLKRRHNPKSYCPLCQRGKRGKN